MKNASTRLLSLVLVLVMVLGMTATVFAEETTDPVDPPANTEPEQPAACTHENKQTAYEPINDGTHWIVTTCSDCGGKADDDIPETCTDANSDGECDKCYADIPEKEECRHTEAKTTYRAGGDGKHFKDIRCAAEGCGYEIETGIIEACTDENEDGKCDLCYVEQEEEEEEQEVYITCSGDGAETTSSAHDMTFVLHGVETDDVQWNITATGSADPQLADVAENGKTASVVVGNNYGVGVAKVTATATWDGGSTSKTAYVSFYQRRSVVFYVKDGQKTFDFMDVGVFDKISGVASNRVEKCSIYSFLTDGCGTRIILDENAKNNRKVGTISFQTTGKFHQYDPDDYNDYGITELGKLNFTPTGEGTYKLNFELYEMAGGFGLATTRGTLSIVVGEPGVQAEDMTYRTAGEPVTFDQEDFIDYWEENCKGEYEALDYVKFTVDSRAYGLLYLDKTLRGEVKSNYKFEPDYKKNTAANTYDLDTVTYKPDPKNDSYTEEIDFVAYGKGSSVVKGTVTVIVGSRLEFADVSNSDWFYESVEYVFSNGIMNGISDTKFDPNGTLNRAMVVTMLYRLEGEPYVYAEGTFSDVKQGQWYTEAVEWAAEKGIVEGMGGGKFAPTAAITREQLATILYRYAAYDKKDTSAGSTKLDEFRDENKVSSWATDALAWAVHNEIMQGADGYLSPRDTATRAQAAAMFCRMIED